MSRRRTIAFSLVEVVIAVGVFATTVAVVLALIPALTRQAVSSADALVAQQLPDHLRAELARLADGRFTAFATSLPEMAAPLADGMRFVANRDGSRLHSVSAPAAGAALAAADQYFLVECWRFPSGPLRFDAATTFVATYARVSWPYQTGTSGSSVALVTPLADRSQLTFTAAINQ
ncbi:MAG: hypothetical protein HY302_02395 [Opitutae bacterium]|nr:hypothetical protein [Opitutae bacterium]